MTFTKPYQWHQDIARLTSPSPSVLHFFPRRHYYAAVSAVANGSLEFASGGDGEFESGGRVAKKKPRSLPLIPPRSKVHPDRPANPCLNPICRAKCVDAFHPVRHGDNCDGMYNFLCNIVLQVLRFLPLISSCVRNNTKMGGPTSLKPPHARSVNATIVKRMPNYCPCQRKPIPNTLTLR